jgi:hypothetical protein
MLQRGHHFVVVVVVVVVTFVVEEVLVKIIKWPMLFEWHSLECRYDATHSDLHVSYPTTFTQRYAPKRSATELFYC